MFNETIQKISYEQITSVTQSPLILIIIGAIWFLPLLFYLLIAIFTHARTSHGEKLKRRMISSPNAWIPLAVWFIVQATLFVLLLIFPFWSNLF